MNNEFVKRMEELGGAFARLPEVLAGTDPEVSVRVNRAKGGKVPQGADLVPWCRDGYYIDSRPQFTSDPKFHQGLYYVQDASSMAQVAAVARAVEIAGRVDSPLRYLDACAAPGGKTTAAVSALPADAFVVANEFDPRRASILVENVAKWGCPSVITSCDASKIKGLDGFFDIVSADVPCSGEGMMRKDEKAESQWSPSLVEQCAARQRGIVRNCWKLLRPGGVMIYSTCTFNPDENERIVAGLIEEFGAIPEEIPALNCSGIVGATSGYDFPAYHFLPGEIRGEGLFMAMLRKPGNSSVQTPKVKARKGSSRSAMAVDVLDGRWSYAVDSEGSVYAVPEFHSSLAEAVAQSCRVINFGINVGQMKGRDFVPAQPLAMAQAVNRKIYPEVEVGLADAVSYLRRESIVLPPDVGRGFVMLTYGGRPLGFVKNLGNRSNNLYPQRWRILSSHFLT